MTQKIVRGVRMEPVLAAKCAAKAAEHDLSFSEWVRGILRQAVGGQTMRKPKR